MDYDDFVKKVMDAKMGNYSHLQDIKVSGDKDHKTMKIYRNHTCSHCNHTTIERLFIKFKEPHRLTIFEAGMLFSVFVLNRKPTDYAQYHKCIAGKNFIENIEKLEVL